MTRTRRNLRIAAFVAIVAATEHARAADTQLLRYAPGLEVAALRLSTAGSSLLAQDEKQRLQWTYSLDSRSFGAAADIDSRPCQGAVSLSLLRYDVNRDGLIDPRAGDFARLYVSASRSRDGPAASTLTALDVTQARAPRLLWVRDAQTLPQLGRLASGVSIARLRVRNGGQDPQHFVVIFGAGLGTGADAAGPGRLYIVDALGGQLLWTGAAANADRVFTAMRAAIAGGVTVLDLNGDDYADRLYVGDLASSLWRFDLWQGQPAATLVTGGVLAALGSPLSAAPRGFLAAPDVALITGAGSAPWFNISIGTQTLSATTVPSDNWLFMLRDRFPFEAWTQPRYDQWQPLRETDLVVADGGPLNPGDSRVAGFRVPLRSGVVAAGTVTAAGVVLYTVVESGSADERFCTTPPPRTPVVVSVNAVDVQSGLPALDLDGNGRRDAQDLRRPLPVAITDARESVQIAAQPDATRCTVGGVRLADCIRLPPLTPTFWRREDAD